MAFEIKVWKETKSRAAESSQGDLEEVKDKEIKKYGYFGRSIIVVDDIREGCRKPKRYPIRIWPKELIQPGCDILFAYDFNFAAEFNSTLQEE